MSEKIGRRGLFGAVAGLACGAAVGSTKPGVLQPGDVVAHAAGPSVRVITVAGRKSRIALTGHDAEVIIQTNGDITISNAKSWVTISRDTITEGHVYPAAFRPAERV